MPSTKQTNPCMHFEYVEKLIAKLFWTQNSDAEIYLRKKNHCRIRYTESAEFTWSDGDGICLNDYIEMYQRACCFYKRRDLSEDQLVNGHSLHTHSGVLITGMAPNFNVGSVKII